MKSTAYKNKMIYVRWIRKLQQCCYGLWVKGYYGSEDSSNNKSVLRIHLNHTMNRITSVCGEPTWQLAPLFEYCEIQDIFKFKWRMAGLYVVNLAWELSLGKHENVLLWLLLKDKKHWNWWVDIHKMLFQLDSLCKKCHILKHSSV